MLNYWKTFSNKDPDLLKNMQRFIFVPTVAHRLHPLSAADSTDDDTLTKITHLLGSAGVSNLLSLCMRLGAHAKT